MRISIFGLGYVGAITAACLAKEGHQVLGVDPDTLKLRLLEDGKSPIMEEGIDELIRQVVENKQLQVCSDPQEAVGLSDLSLICVGTPSRDGGAADLRALERVITDVGQAVRNKARYHSIVVRSTVPPGTTEGVVRPLLTENCGGQDHGLSFHPEFLREGTAIHDFYSPPLTVIGTESKPEFERLAKLYDGISTVPMHTSLAAAEMAKYACNIFHAVKVTLANEIGALCRHFDVDGREVMEIVCTDTELNISSKYLRPGFAFGGSCLPKDLRAIVEASRRAALQIPMLEAVLPSNKNQVERAAQRIMQSGRRKLALLGLSFKEKTDDLRESPLVALAETLIGRGFDLKIYDPSVEYSALHGSNKVFIDRELPHLRKILCSPREVLEHADILVVGHGGPQYVEIVRQCSPEQEVFDLIGLTDKDDLSCQYVGLYW